MSAFIDEWSVQIVMFFLLFFIAVGREVSQVRFALACSVLVVAAATIASRYDAVHGDQFSSEYLWTIVPGGIGIIAGRLYRAWRLGEFS